MNIKMIDFRGYRLSVDDVILCFKDIYLHPEYTSLFDNAFFKLYRDIHEKYGTKVHFNIYYETTDGKFNLSMFPDKYKDEFKKNSDWLHLSFHARQDLPNWPYRGAGYDKVYNDCKLVQNEILRFAGIECMPPMTTLHFADTTKDGVRALRDCGIKLLQGDFVLKDGKPYIAYYFNREQFDKVRNNCFYYDAETDMVFYACDVVLNTGERETICDRMDEFRNMYPNRPFVDILIHEQYFYRDYSRYLPDYRQRIETGIKWCEDNGYKPIFALDMINLK